MKAMVLPRPGKMESSPLKLREVPVPKPRKGEVLVRVLACGVCRTDLDVAEGRIKAKRNVIPGHQIVGEVVKTGPGAKELKKGERVGTGWIHSSCGSCSFCRKGLENLCPRFSATGRDFDGGFAEYAILDSKTAFRVPKKLSSEEAAPLLCAGSVGYRALKLSGLKNGENLGLVGFGASNHIVLKAAKAMFPDSRIYVFARNPVERRLARRLGASWTGGIGSIPKERMDSIIDTTPAWRPFVRSLRVLKPGGRLVVNAIEKIEQDKSTLLEIDYRRDLWLEKEIKSVANVTPKDISSFLSLASRAGIKPEVQAYPLEEANRALLDLKKGRIKGAKVLKP